MKPIQIFFVAVLVGAAFVTGRATRPEQDSTARAPRGDTPEVTRLKAQLEEARTETASAVARREAAEAALAGLRESASAATGPGIGGEEACEPEAEPAPAAPDEPPPPPSDEELKAALADFGRHLQGLITGSPAALEAAQQFRALFARASAEQVGKLVATFEDDTGDIGKRLVLAHALAQSGRPEAIAALAESLGDPESGMMVQRFAAHALAFSPAEGVVTILTQAAHRAEDRGVRANASFGLIRHDVEEGVKLYFAATDEAFEANDPAALQYLSGFALMGDKGLPGLRERLKRYAKNPQAVLVIIEVLKGRGDVASIPELEKLAYDANQPKAIQKAAEGALKVLRKARDG